MSASWGNASTRRTIELVDVDGDGLELMELPLGAGPYERGSVHVLRVGRGGEVVLSPAQAGELAAWLRAVRGHRSVSPFDVVFPGADAAQRRACKLAMFALAQPIAERDPLARDVTGRLMRDLEVTRAGARRVLELLRRGGWVDEHGRLGPMMQT